MSALERSGFAVAFVIGGIDIVFPSIFLSVVSLGYLDHCLCLAGFSFFKYYFCSSLLSYPTWSFIPTWYSAGSKELKYIFFYTIISQWLAIDDLELER